MQQVQINAVDTEQMTELILSITNIQFCRRYQLLPIKRLEQEPPAIVIAMVNPDDLEALDLVEKLLRSKRLGLQRVVISKENYEHLVQEYQRKEQEHQKPKEILDKYLDEQVKQEEKAQHAKAVDVSLDIESFGSATLSEAPSEMEEEIGANDAEEAPIINLVNKILAKALQDNASDIHVEPQEEHVRVRFRKDGVLTQPFPALPKKIVNAVVARFKIMADLDIAERRLPQDGKIRRLFRGRMVDFRVNILPSRHGETVVLKILDNTLTQLALDCLITDENTLNSVRDIASRPLGLILVTGPINSGKSTTLYSILAERNEPSLKICTVEDPIEYTLPGITQVQVIREKGMDFASILQACLCQDPDIILVEEIRDKETAKTAIEAALSGYLVLTTLPWNDAAGAIAYLNDIGVEPFMISYALLGVLAQRLMRKVCSECRIAYHPTQEELARFGLSAFSEHAVTFYQANSLTVEQWETARVEGELCPKCHGSGYKGRIGVYEFMVITERLQKLIHEGATTALLKEAAVEEGMNTLLAYSLKLVQEGLTTLEEVERISLINSGWEAEMKAKRKSSLTCSNCRAELQQEWLDCPYCITPRFKIQ